MENIQGNFNKSSTKKVSTYFDINIMLCFWLSKISSQWDEIRECKKVKDKELYS